MPLAKASLNFSWTQLMLTKERLYNDALKKVKTYIIELHWLNLVGAARKLWKIDRAALLKWLVELLGRGGHLAVVVSRRILLLILSDDLRLHVLIDRRKHVTWISE